MTLAPPMGGESTVGPTELVRIARNSVDFRTGEIWYTAQVTGRMESHFAEKLIRQGFKAFTPLERVVSYRKRKGREDARRCEYHRAIWPKYSFFAGGDDAIYAAKATNLMQLILPQVNQRRLVDQLESLSEQLRDDDHYDVPRELESGAWYRLLWPHPFGGYVGVLTIDKGRVTIGLSVFGDTRPVEIDDKHLDLLERV